MISLHARRLAVAKQSLRPRFQPHVRYFWNVPLPVASGPGGAHITKYHIVRPGKEGVEWDDFLIALPDREHLASSTKEVPLFVRYLKLVCDQEGRADDFAAFYERAKSGLVVESDAFINTEELLALMWKNGFSESERNAIMFTFPSDYKFHYPELSVLFSIPEEDTYKFCMRTRMEASHIGELDHSQVKRKGFLRDHWVMFGTGIVIFKTFPFFNYYFGLKVFGTSMWVYSVWSLLNRMVAQVCRRNEYMAAQKTAQDVMEGEDKIVTAMQRFANDAKAVNYLTDFKPEMEAKIAEYKKGLILKMKEELSERAMKQLTAIASFEAGMSSALQELVVKEAAASFKDKFPTDKAMKASAFTSALKTLSGDAAGAAEDPVSKHFMDAFASLQNVDLMSTKGDPKGSLAERVAYAQQLKEKEFQTSFMVTAKEASDVKAIAGTMGKDLDLSKLPADAATKLEGLYTSINAKVGYALPLTLATKPIDMTSDTSANSYAEKVNSQLAAMSAQIREARLKTFVQAFQ
eukprot:CAMPEP_0178400208 /NCGR_PEP_ID=MMETSP0689_2-20121128/15672_1 /TAXON_ID=160604 /ORGANISM="Amphidinium massartii, Strain CS-259" /LENGTH=519 /DNA_ID=CAMNT_0020020999 /DNA_START=87 /DNA_END=1646 /DNA_ORIENTATION=+